MASKQARSKTGHAQRSERDQVSLGSHGYYDAILGYRNYWYPAVFEDELGAKPIPVTLLGERVLLHKIDGRVCAIEDRCPHRLVPLSAKIECYSKNTITCWYHGWTFDWRDGTIVSLLTEPDSALVGKAGVKTYPVEVAKGMVFVFIGDEEPSKLSDDVPPAFLEPDRVMKGIRRVVNSNWRWGCENGFDSTHIYIHRASKLITTTNASLPLGLVPKSKLSMEVFDKGDPKGVYDNAEKNYTAIFSADVEGVTVSAHNPTPHDPSKGPPPVSAGSIWMPGVLQIETAVIPHQNQYEFYVPIDEKSHMYFQVLGKTCHSEEEAEQHRKMVDEVWTDLQLHGFNDDDVWAREAMEDAYTNGGGWTRERLFKPDACIVAWRKLASKHNRGIQGRGL